MLISLNYNEEISIESTKSINKFFFNNVNQKIVNIIKQLYPGTVSFFMVRKQGGYHLYLKPMFLENFNNYQIFYFLKNNFFFKFNQLLDIVCIDLLNLFSKTRLELVYNCLNVVDNVRIYIHIFLELLSKVKSLVTLYKSANWLEREVFEMFGVLFEGHNDLRRLLLDYGFKGFPMRKEFPMIGFVELHYEDAQSTIVVEPLELAQEYRVFRHNSTYKGYVS